VWLWALPQKTRSGKVLTACLDASCGGVAANATPDHSALVGICYGVPVPVERGSYCISANHPEDEDLVARWAGET